MQETIEQIVGYFRYVAQGLEKRKQILRLLGPVGGGKSTPAGLKDLNVGTPGPHDQGWRRGQLGF